MQESNHSIHSPFLYSSSETACEFLYKRTLVVAAFHDWPQTFALSWFYATQALESKIAVGSYVHCQSIRSLTSNWFLNDVVQYSRSSTQATEIFCSGNLKNSSTVWLCTVQNSSIEFNDFTSPQVINVTGENSALEHQMMQRSIRWNTLFPIKRYLCTLKIKCHLNFSVVHRKYNWRCTMQTWKDQTRVHHFTQSWRGKSTQSAWVWHQMPQRFCRQPCNREKRRVITHMYT